MKVGFPEKPCLTTPVLGVNCRRQGETVRHGRTEVKGMDSFCFIFDSLHTDLFVLQNPEC